MSRDPCVCVPLCKRCVEKKQPHDGFRMKRVFQLLVYLVYLTLKSDGREVQGERGYIGWHEQLLTEKQDPLVTIATLV